MRRGFQILSTTVNGQSPTVVDSLRYPQCIHNLARFSVPSCTLQDSRYSDAMDNNSNNNVLPPSAVTDRNCRKTSRPELAAEFKLLLPTCLNWKGEWILDFSRMTEEEKELARRLRDF